MSDAQGRHDDLGQPEPDEVDITDNSTGTAPDEHRLDEIADEATERSSGD